MAFFHIANFWVSPSECVVRVYSVVKKGSRTQYRESWSKDYRKESAALVTFTSSPHGSDSQNLMRVKRSFPFLRPICYSLAKSCPPLCNPMDCSMPGFHILHYLPEFAQIHVHWVGDAIQPSHLLSSPSPPAFNQGLKTPDAFPASGSFPMSWLFPSGASIGASASASVLPMNIQGWFPLGLTDLTISC